MNKSKKIISIIAAATLAFSTVALAGCGAKDYAGEKLTAGYDAAATVSSNGGFAVEKGNYVYFINGSESNTADNTYGDVVKGSLMRISKKELADAKYDAAQIVIPSLMVAGDYTAGLFVYGEYVYYATPTTDKNLDGEIQNSYLDFKRSKLDGSEAPSDYFFRLSSNTAKYRFVEVDGTVYCMFEEDSKLKSYNVETGKTTVLVSGAKSSFFYDTKDATNPNVYYTMGVTYDLDEENSTTAQYDQVYMVNAATTIATTSGDNTVGYTAKLGDKEVASYAFKKSYVEENGDVDDYTTYPYVNAGSLVLDGVGSASSGADSSDTRFNKDDKADSTEPIGYNYTIQSYQNDGLYFTRKALTTTASETENSKLYYVADAREDWNTVKGNALVDVVALDTTYASTSALFEVAQDGAHSYYYVDGSVLKKATVGANAATTTMNLAYEVSSATLWKTEGDYLYYYSSASNGNNITRINCTGNQDNYNPLLATDEYKPLTLPLVDWNSAWYKPEFIDVDGAKVVFYSNAQSYGAGSTAYNYIYATKLGTTEEILATKEALDTVNDFIDEQADSQLQIAMEYYFKTGKTKAFNDVRALYEEKELTEDFDNFVAMFEDGGEFEGMLETSYVAPVSRMTKADEDAIAQNWADSLLSETEEEEEESGLPTWALILIIVGGVLVVGGATAGIWYYVAKKKAAAKKAESVVNAYRNKIDTTDDKTIDVYADEEAEETAAEEAPVEAEEAVKEVVEEAPVEEAPAEETPVETTEATVEEAPVETPVESTDAPAEEN